MKRLFAAVAFVVATLPLGAQQPPAPAGGQEAAVQKQPQVKSKEEADGVMAMFNAQDPDSRIKAANDLLSKFADTDFKALALMFAAESYRQKNDFENMIIYAERTLQAEPKGQAALQANLMLAQGIAQRTREHDLDREEKLTQAEKYAHSAQDMVKTLPKPRPDITDEQWESAKKDINSQAHEALGMIAMARKKHDVAINEFKTAVETASNPDPATMVRLGAVYNLAGKHDEAIAVLDKVMNAPDVHPTIKQFAQAERARAIQAKGGAKPAGQPAQQQPAPQVEIKRQP